MTKKNVLAFQASCSGEIIVPVRWSASRPCPHLRLPPHHSIQDLCLSQAVCSRFLPALIGTHLYLTCGVCFSGLQVDFWGV